MKLSQIIEAVDNTDKKIRAIAQLTDNNDHGGAIVVGLTLLGTDKLVKDLLKKTETIMDKHDKLGHMDQGMTNDRMAIYKKMMSIAKKRMDSKTFNAFHGAF